MITALAALAAVALSGLCSAEPPQYEVLVLDVPYYAEAVRPWGLNDRAQIVGSYGPDVEKPFLWDRGQFIPLELPFDYSVAVCYDLNEAGQITGIMSDYLGWPHGFLYEDGSYTDLGIVDGGTTTWALAINNSAQIAGYSGNHIHGPWCAFLWEDGVLYDLSADFSTTDSRGLDLNDHGQMTGFMWTGDDVTTFIWSQGQVQDLGPAPGGYANRGEAINNFGEVAIQGALSHSEGHGFFYSEGEMTDIGLVPGATRCNVLDMNDSAEIVGYCDEYGQGPGLWAFVWRDGEIHALQDCVPPELDLELKWGYAVNELGQVTAGGYMGSDSVTVLLSPANPRPADVNRDGVVDIDDLFEILGNWGPCPDEPQMCPADVDEDSSVDVDDIFALLADWG